MTIGIPKALLYYQYGVLWKSFFAGLSCDVVVSDNTNEAIFLDGSRDSISECCLPAKVYLGHVRFLRNRCDYILSPYVDKKKGGDAICTRFWGMGDVIRHTYPSVKLLEYAIYDDNAKSQYKNFRNIGKQLGKRSALIRDAYEAATEAQSLYDKKLREAQSYLLSYPGLKIMLTGRPYVMHDPYIGGPVVNILSELGISAFFSDRFDRRDTLSHSVDISPRLYWTANREAIGAIATYKNSIDGVLMLTAFPCAQDALACEMASRVVDGIPISIILLDGLQGEAGLQTRIESFIDILSERKTYSERRAASHFVPTHGQLSYND